MPVISFFVGLTLPIYFLILDFNTRSRDMVFKFIICCLIGLWASKTFVATEDPKIDAFSSGISLKNEIISEDNRTILSYEDVLGFYYQKVLEKSEKVFTYEDFRDGYYSDENNLGFFEYADTFCSEPLFANNNGTAQDSLRSTEKEKEPDRSSGDDDYVLSDDYYSITPTSEFTRRPYNLAFSYSSIKKGDLVFESNPLFGIGHIGIIINKYKNSQSYGTYIQTVEAFNSGVKYAFLDDLRIIEKQVLVLRVVGYTSTKANGACAFAENQMGASYGDPTVHTWQTDNSDHWFCSELVYAAWYRQDINILEIYDENNHVVLPYHCWPIDIYNSFNTTELNIDRYEYLSVSLVGKDWNKWAVQITNESSEEVHVYVNRKMCFGNDAINWTSLNDLVSFYMDPNESFNFYIETNWFATHIALCFVVGQIRFLTYGWELTQTGNTFSLLTGNVTMKA